MDLHFAPHEPTIAAVATSTGDLCFFCLVNSAPEPLLEQVSRIQVFEPDILVLSLNWAPVSRPSDHTTIAVSLSNGNVAIIAFSTNFQSPQLLWQSTVHPLEAWTVTYSPATREGLPCFLYSGGDDSALCTRKLDSEEATLTYDSVARDSKSHGAGVTAILPLPMVNNMDGDILLTGSYDEYLRVYDTVNTPRVLAEVKLGGGAWRLKLMSFSELRESSADSMATYSGVSVIVLASCMHAGARVLKVNRDAKGQWSIKVLAKFEEHESMNYASDVQPRSNIADGEKSDGFTCVSTSFYDRKLCVWKYEEGIGGL